jgi:hypothetical protein
MEKEKEEDRKKKEKEENFFEKLRKIKQEIENKNLID